jgi:hypothetical protein
LDGPLTPRILSYRAKANAPKLAPAVIDTPAVIDNTMYFTQQSLLLVLTLTFLKGLVCLTGFQELPKDHVSEYQRKDYPKRIPLVPHLNLPPLFAISCAATTNTFCCCWPNWAVACAAIFYPVFAHTQCHLAVLGH